VHEEDGKRDGENVQWGVKNIGHFPFITFHVPFEWLRPRLIRPSKWKMEKDKRKMTNKSLTVYFP